jgi:hypothetical protein
VKFLVIALVLFSAHSLAQSGTPRTGSSAEISIILRGAAQPALIEVRTDPAVTKNEELRFWIYRNDDDSRAFDSRVVPPVEPGLYRLEYTFPEKGSWELRMRYGTGLDLYYANVSNYLEPSQEKTLNFRETFYGSLSTSTPRYIQPLGFGIFALMLVIALTLVVTILRWLKRQQKTALNSSRA